jgi:ribosomal-protein-alanine N-acetyltransferase
LKNYFIDGDYMAKIHFNLRIFPLTEEHGKEICTWTYTPPYDIYNWPSWEQMMKDDYEFADPLLRQNQYGAAVDKHYALCGFVQFFPIIGVTRLGLGLRPDLCGKGLGSLYVQLLVQEAKLRAPLNNVDLEVITWNDRAIKTYLSAGFEITDTYERMTPTGNAQFHCMDYMESR